MGPLQGFSGVPAGRARLVDLARGISPTSNVGYSSIDNITDGDDSTQGNSQTVATPQYVRLKLGGLYRLIAYRVKYSDSSHSSATGYLEISRNDDLFLPVIAWSGITSTDRLQRFPDDTWARYLRLYTTTTGNPGVTGVDIKTLEVWGYR